MTQPQVNGKKRFVVDPDLAGEMSVSTTSGDDTRAPWRDLFQYSTSLARKPSQHLLGDCTALGLVPEHNLCDDLLNSLS